MRARRSSVFALVLGASLLTGCPAPKPEQTGEVSLKLLADPAPTGTAVALAEPIQLRLRFDGGQDRRLMGALIDDGTQAETKWFVEPEGAAEVDANTAQIKLKQAGKVKVWATFRQGERTLTSNVIELGGVASATSAN